MTEAKLKRLNYLQNKIKQNNNLTEHLNRKIDDPINEVQKLLTGYSNLMSGFDRTELARHMIMTIYNQTKFQTEELKEEFEKL